MPKKKTRLNTNKTVTKKQITPVPDVLPETKDAKRRKRKNFTIAIASAIIAVIIGVSVFGWWLVYKKPLQASIATVNGQNISVDYILRRCLWSITDANTGDTTGTASPLSIIQSTIQDLIIEQVASKPPYNISVSEADIDTALKQQADASLSGSTSTTGTTTPALSDSEYKEWYRQMLNISQLTESEFRDYVKARIMEQRLTDYLSANMSLNVPQVHVYDIVVADGTTGTEIQNRINNGEDFQTIARELSTDTSTKDAGGDMGWVPIDVLKAIDSVIGVTAEDLEIGQVSYPVQLSTALSSTTDSTTQPYYLLMVTEKDPARLVSDSQFISTLKGTLIGDWINNQMDPSKSSNKVTLHGHGQSGGYDSSTNAWILYEIEKLKHSRGIKDETTTTETNPISGQ